MIRILLLTFLIAVSCSMKRDLETAITANAGEAVCWMTPLPDDVPFARLSIPGAHDAATATITSLTLWTKTQDLDIAGLWNCGVRAFDLRPAYVDGTMGIYHDRYSTNTAFMEAINALVTALDTHPGEAAVVIMRHEEEADENTPEWGPAMAACLQSVRPHIAIYHSGITLGELRGKILILSRNTYDKGPIGSYISGWTSSDDPSAQQGATITNEQGDTSPLWVQDYYHPDGPEDKWKQIKSMLDATAGAGEPYPLVINHTSGYVGKLPDYRTNAGNVNARAAEYISSKGAPAGIVMMDFAGVDRSNGKEVGGLTLVQALIQ